MKSNETINYTMYCQCHIGIVSIPEDREMFLCLASTVVVVSRNLLLFFVVSRSLLLLLVSISSLLLG